MILPTPGYIKCFRIGQGSCYTIGKVVTVRPEQKFPTTKTQCCSSVNSFHSKHHGHWILHQLFPSIRKSRHGSAINHPVISTPGNLHNIHSFDSVTNKTRQSLNLAHGANGNLRRGNNWRHVCSTNRPNVAEGKGGARNVCLTKVASCSLQMERIKSVCVYSALLDKVFFMKEGCRQSKTYRNFEAIEFLSNFENR